MAEVDTEATVQVRGEAVIRAEPDEAVLWIALTAIEDSPGSALADVSKRSRELAGLLEELGVGAADRSTGGVTVSEEFDHTSQGRRSLGHRATGQTSVRLSDPELVGRLISRAAEELAAQIVGPRWQIAPGNPVRLEAAREAARDAERKARAYAEGLGVRLGRPLRLVEPGDRPVMIRAAARSAGPESLPIDPGEQEVSAVIEVTFALEPGGGA